MSDREDSRSPSRSRNRASERVSPRRKRSRSSSDSDRSTNRGRQSRSRSPSYGHRKSYRSHSRSHSPQYKRKARYDQSPESSEDGRVERYRKNSNHSLNEDMHRARPRTTRESSPENNHGQESATNKCNHFQPFDPNCKVCLSDKRHTSILSRYNKRMMKFKENALPDVDVRGHWYPLKRCSRSHSREYQLVCRTCRRLGALCLYPSWAYEHCDTAPGQDDDANAKTSNFCAMMIASVTPQPDAIHEVLILKDGTESVFYEFPVDMKGQKGEACDCDQCTGSDMDIGIRESKDSYRDHRKSEMGAYGKGGYSRGARRRWSTEEMYDNRGGHQSSNYRKDHPPYDNRYNNSRGEYDHGYQDDGYRNSYHHQHYGDKWGSDGRNRRGDGGQQYYREKPYWTSSDRGRSYGGRGRGRGSTRGNILKRYRQDYSERYTSSRENPGTSRCVGVFGLSLYTEERDLREVFGRYGPITDVQMVYDHNTGKSRGFAFIYFRNLDDAIEAKERGPGTEIDGHKVRVDFSVTERAHTPTPGIYLGKASGRGYGSRRESNYSRRSASPEYHRRARYSRSRSRSYSPRRY